MTTLTTDGFIEAFAAQMIEKGQSVIRLNDPAVRERLLNIFEFLDEEVEVVAHKSNDQDWLRSLINIRNLFQPSPIGAFDKFEAIMRSRQSYLTEHPNPYYQDIVFRLPAAAAASVIQSLESPLRDLIGRTVEQFLKREKVDA
jgi:hypothetical protein